MNPIAIEDNSHDSRLSDRFVDLVERANLKSSAERLMASRTHLQMIGLTNEEIKRVKTVAAREHVIFQTAAEYETQMSGGQLKFGCQSLDCIIRNGLNSGITEISGESGVGKSQICLQLSLMVQLSVARGGLEKAAVFVCTEDAFPSKRLFQIADVFAKRYGDRNYLDNIFIEHVHDSEHLLECILVRLPKLMGQKSIGLVVIDSVAGVFRSESNVIARANRMRKFAHELQIISRKYRCAVVCVNQVTALFNNYTAAKSTPSLGLAWSNLVTTRIQMEKTSDNYTIQSINRVGKIMEKSIPIRKLSVIFSPDIPRASTTFMITADGIVDVPAL